MGLFKMSASCYDIPRVGRIEWGPPSTAEREVMATRLDPRRFVPATAAPNPNPRRFTILRMQTACDRHLVALVRYPDCTTYEGRKVLVFADTTVPQLVGAEVLDPHFAEHTPTGALVPIARFEPTERGWRLALLCAWAL